MVIRVQNAKDGLTGEKWNRDKFYRLCRLLHCQPEELAARYFIPPNVMGRWLADDSIPPYVSLHFILLERGCFQCAGKKKMNPETNGTPRHDWVVGSFEFHFES